MKVNMGTTDRLLRSLVAAPLLIVAGVLVGPGGWLAVVLYAFAAAMLLTSAVASCPMYSVLGIRTCSLQKTS